MRRIYNELSQGFVAGGLIGLGGFAFLLAKYYFNNILIAALCFPIGLFFICLIGAHLYTGRIGYLLETFEKNDIKQRSIDLILMLIGNIIGALVVGFIFRICTSNISEIDSTASLVANIRTISKINIAKQINECLIKSILCGILVYLAVYLFKKSTTLSEKAISIWLPITLFVFCGFDHCIADVFYVTASTVFNPSSIGYITIAIIGNSIGAIVLNEFLRSKKV